MLQAALSGGQKQDLLSFSEVVCRFAGDSRTGFSACPALLQVVLTVLTHSLDKAGTK